MEQDSATEYDAGLESTDPVETDDGLGDAIRDGTSNTIVPGGGGS